MLWKYFCKFYKKNYLIGDSTLFLMMHVCINVLYVTIKISIRIFGKKKKIKFEACKLSYEV